ncbi:MAG: hypothetical protein IKB07_01600 [Lachnospiraceae bacterium]|nr:hypothetical protein [Lachnospiraceae bacterium]
MMILLHFRKGMDMNEEMENKTTEETVETVDVEETNVTEESAEASVAEDTTVQEDTPAPAEEAVSEEKKTAEKKAPKAKGSKKLIVIAAAAVAAVLVIANAPKIGNAAVKLFTSPAGYLQHILEKESDKAIEKIADTYDETLSTAFSDDKSTKVEVGVEVGEDVRDMLEDATSVDFGWMEKVSFNVGADTKKDAMQANAGFSLNGKQLLGLLVMADMEEKVGYLQVPELNDTYLGMELEELFDMTGMDMDDLNEAKAMLDDVYKSLPDKSKLEKVMKRYSSLAISCIEDVEQDKEKVTVGELTDSYTVLEATIDEGTLQAMMEVMVEELKKDKDVKNILKDILSTQDEIDFDDVYDEFLDALEDSEDFIDDLDDVKFEAVLKLYVDNEGKIYGVEVEVEDLNAEISSLMVHKGGKFAYELAGKVNGVKASFEGEGKLSSTKLNGDFKLKAVGMKLADITVTDLKVKDLEEGYLNGKIRFSLASAVVDAIEDEMDELPIDLGDFVFEIDATSSKNKSDVKFALYEKDSFLGSLFVIAETGKADKIKFPGKKEVVMVEDEDDLLDWAGEIDFDEFLESLEGKLDDELLEVIDDIVSGDISLWEIEDFVEDMYDEVFGYDDYYDDYWYDEDDYWYDDEYYDDEYYDDYWYDDDYSAWGEDWY